MTDLSPREKALVEAARLARDTFRHMALDSIADTLEQALRAYDPPKPKVPVLPPWEELGNLQKYDVHRAVVFAALKKTPSQKDTEKVWDAIRTLTSKEQE